MKYSKIYAGMAVVAAWAAVSCSSSEQKETVADVQDIRFDYYSDSRAYSLENSLTDYESDEDLTIGCKASLFVPLRYMGNDVSAFRDSVFKVAFDTIAPTAREAAEWYFAETVSETGYEGVSIDVPEDSRSTSYDGFVETEGSIAAMTPDYISYAVTQSVYYPRAAHGLYATRYIVYATAPNQVVTLTDLFTPEGIEALPRIIRARAIALQGVIGQTDIRSLPADGNYYITTGMGIVFAYQPYEVASYAQGAINVGIQPYDVCDYLTPLGKQLLLNE